MFTLVACLVVVGLSAAAVLWQTRGGAHQPATEPGPPHRQSGPGHDERGTTLRLAEASTGEDRPGPSTWLPAPPPPAEQVGTAPLPQGVTIAPTRTVWSRLRAAASLFLIVVLIGTLVAAALGAAAALAAFALREAVR